MSPPSIETTRDWPAKAMVDREGDSLGRIVYIYLDRVTGQPTWALVAPGRLRRRPAVFVPLAQAVHEGDRVRVPVPRAAVLEAPGGGRRRELAQKHEVRLLEHYGELAGLTSSRAGARRASMGAQAASRLRRWPRQGLQRATAAPRRVTRSRALRGPLLGGLGLAGSLTANRLLAARGRPRMGLRAAPRAAATAVALRRLRTARRRPFIVVVNARPSRPRVPAPSLPSLSRRRRSSSMRGNLGMAVGFAAGYVFGSKAGRERYDQIVEQARRFWQRPEVQNLVTRGRETTSAGVEQAAGRAGDQLRQARSSVASGERERTGRGRGQGQGG